jgi:hypothetical protein
MFDIDDHTTKQDVINLINSYLNADDGEPLDAEKIYEHFYNKGVHWLMYEFILGVVEEDENRLNEIAAELE